MWDNKTNSQQLLQKKKNTYPVIHLMPPLWASNLPLSVAYNERGKETSTTIMHHTTPAKLTYDTIKASMLHYSLSPLILFLIFLSFVHNYNNKLLQQIMHNTIHYPS